MNTVHEEHRIRLVKHYTIHDSFTTLWASIASQQRFLKLNVSSSHPSNEEIAEKIKHRHGSISPYSSKVFDNSITIYNKGTTVIVTNNLLHSLGTFFAVEDSDSPNRYFVGFAFSVGSMESITGMTIYFNENGYCDIQHRSVCQQVIATYDVRNGLIRNSHIFFYHQSLVFTQIHRDTHKVMLYLCYIPYHSDTVENHSSYYIDYSANPHSSEIVLCKRYLFCELNDKCILFDLGSLDLITEVDRDVMLLHSYSLRKKEDVLSFLEMASLFPEKKYTDGYPTRCIKCDQPTFIASFGYKASSNSFYHAGLGNSYCSVCMIRYSDTKKSWVCAQVQLDGIICDGYLRGEYVCTSDHLHSSDQSLVIMIEGKQHKSPYRTRICLHWVPSEDAREAARLSKDRILYFDDVNDVNDVNDLGVNDFEAL